MSSWTWEADNPCSVASVPLAMAHHPFTRCIWQNIWIRKRNTDAILQVQFPGVSLNATAGFLCSHTGKMAVNGKRYKKGHKSLRDEEPFKGVESEKAQIVLVWWKNSGEEMLLLSLNKQG